MSALCVSRFINPWNILKFQKISENKKFLPKQWKKPDSYKKGFVQHKTWIPAIGNNCMNQSETQPPKRKNRKQNLWENEKKKYPPPTRYP